jgi:hypothetical protein
VSKLLEYSVLAYTKKYLVKSYFATTLHLTGEYVTSSVHDGGENNSLTSIGLL